jgi:hypothetical protein
LTVDLDVTINKFLSSSKEFIFEAADGDSLKFSGFSEVEKLISI